MKINKYIITLVTASITLILFMLPVEDQITSLLQVLFGSFFILFIPGYFCTLSFFTENEIDLIERIALSFALSISIVPLLSFYLNLIGVPVHFYTIFLIVCGIILGNIVYQSISKKQLGILK